MPEAIRLLDLVNPVHSAAATAALTAVEALPFELSTEAVIERARAESDVPLYEEEGLLERLSEYIDAVLADRGYNKMGRLGTFDGLKRYLIQRSRLEALYAAHPRDRRDRDRATADHRRTTAFGDNPSAQPDRDGRAASFAATLGVARADPEPSRATWRSRGRSARQWPSEPRSAGPAHSADGEHV